jgi:hypothetical protein
MSSGTAGTAGTAAGGAVEDGRAEGTTTADVRGAA